MKLFKDIKMEKSKLFIAFLISGVTLTLISIILLPACTFKGGIGKLSIDSSAQASVKDTSASDSSTGSNKIQEQTDNGAGKTGDGISIEKEVLIIGTDTTYPPFEYLENGEPAGFDIDLIKEIAVRMDKQLEIVPIQWDQDFKDLREGKVDMIISAVSYNTEKEKLVDYSQAYFNMKYLLISLTGSDIKAKEDIKGKKVGILQATDGNVDPDYLVAFEIVKYHSILDMLDELKNKKIAAVLLSLPIAANILQANRDIYTVFDEVQSIKDLAIVFNEGSPLKQEVDAVLAEIIKDGTLQEIYKKWFDSL